MTELTEKEAMLENAGYLYHFDRMIYFNRDSRKAFSLEFVEDHSHEEIHHLVEGPPPDHGWFFYFNEPPSDNIKRQLASALER
jgi:hypothetical protein